MDLTNKTVVITGGTGQVGTALSKKLAGYGAQVIAIVRRDLDSAQSKMSAISPNCKALLADVRNLDSLKQAASEIGSCDILINAHGFTRNIEPVNINELTEEIFDEIIDVNLKGTFNSIKAFKPYIKEGIIINISSTSGLRASKSNLAYGAAKAGIDLITKTLAKAFAPSIRVVGIAPGYLINATSGVVKGPKANDFIASITPLNRVGTAEDIAETVESIIKIKHITGQTIVVDGGVTL